jgi:hypothetical protein
MLRKTLLVCGILASLLYLGIDLLAALRFPAYHSFTSRAISELMLGDLKYARTAQPLAGLTVVEL